MNFLCRLAIFLPLLGMSFQLNAQTKSINCPKNIIIMISDGCGYNQILATDYFIKGKAESQPYEKFPVKMAMSSFPASLSDKGPLINPATGYLPDSAWSGFSYLEKGWTDSSPAATTMASGVKTYNGSIGMDVNHKPLFNATQLAERLGKAAGVVTTVPFSHATPAGFVAHNISRNNYVEIAREMLFDSKLEVIMGCGNPDFDNNGRPFTGAGNYQYVGGENVWKGLKQGMTTFQDKSDSGNGTVQDIDGDGNPDPWTLIEDKDHIIALEKGKVPKRVLGIPQVNGTLQQERTGKEDTTAFSVPFTSNLPMLKDLALAALNILKQDSDGFFLMIEGGAVDWADHSLQKGRMIEEENDFNMAVEAVIQWIESHGGWAENLLIVTADHESGYLTGPLPNNNSPLKNPIINHGKGKMPDMKFNSTDHTNQLVPFFAKGASSHLFYTLASGYDPVRGKYIDNTDIMKVILQVWPEK
ncbi:MAG: alkaline phosphatase [Bacteroidetes bacterium]|nr:alkaline phosphatase [Bacteroidota bacterium]